MKLSVVIPTKNEASNIEACLKAFAEFKNEVELIVVDNFSSDKTCELAKNAGAIVFDQGPERCAQRNRGWREAKGKAVMFVDADMIVPVSTMREILALDLTKGYYIPEVRVGQGLRLRARNFERSFYNGTCIDALRVIPKLALEQVGGYDERLIACEDWDLDRRLLTTGLATAITVGNLFHNEAKQTLAKFLKKKAYYSESIGIYRKKWNEDSVIAQQFGLGYRFFGVFFSNGGWKRMLSHPILAVVMYFERFAVGVVYLLRRH